MVERVAERDVDVDCVIVGAGFGGLRALIEMRKRDLSARIIEAGTDVGGTWYWNRYPGARTDSESWVYCFSFDEDLLQEYDWRDRYPDQAQVHEYLSHVADRFELRRDIEFNTRVQTIARDADNDTWTVRSEDGREWTCTYVITAVGPLSYAYEPPFPGLDSFEGETYLSSRWPKEEVDFTGKRVGIVGTGATGVQLIPSIARTAAQLTVFQRTPNYVVPGRNNPLEENQRQAIKADYPAIWEQVRSHVFAFPMTTAGRVITDVSEEERVRILERGWEVGGFRYLFETFDDLLTNAEANEIASEFVRNKIRSIVEDPETAELLCPTNHPFAAKRPPLGHYYFETFNRDNVSLVSVSENPIQAVTTKGLRLEDGTEYECDMLVFATGFDAATGSITAMDVRGSEGQTIKEFWREGAQSHLGIATKGFPNLFMLAGPHTPFANFPPVVENSVVWIADAITYMRENGIDVMEAEQEAMDAWQQKLEDIIDATILRQGEAVNSWFLGANIPGKAHKAIFYLGGANHYFADLQDSADNVYSGFTFSKAGGAAMTPA